MNTAFGWAAIVLAGLAALTLGVQVGSSYRRAAVIQGMLSAAFLSAFLLMTYFPPTP